ncbi:MAG: hypothetical protein KY476_20625 [Planctomycetes bacterium]|nr:hypothetical protein [Planctomycetota bacterium]
MTAGAKTTTIEDYRRQLRECARTLAVGRSDSVRGWLAPGSTAEMVKLFTDGNLDKRYQKLHDELELLDEAFDDLDESIVEYVKTFPLAAYDTGASDAGCFMTWIEDSRELSDEQCDLVTCLRSRHAVELRAVANRLAHVRFQELAQSVDSFAPEWGENPRLRIHANPIHVRAVFQTRILLDEDDDVPAEVVFFPDGNDIRTAVLEDEPGRLLEMLAGGGHATFDELEAGEPGLTREELLELCIELADLGLVAFG